MPLPYLPLFTYLHQQSRGEVGTHKPVLSLHCGGFVAVRMLGKEYLGGSGLELCPPVERDKRKPQI